MHNKPLTFELHWRSFIYYDLSIVTLNWKVDNKFIWFANFPEIVYVLQTSCCQPNIIICTSFVLSYNEQTVMVGCCGELFVLSHKWKIMTLQNLMTLDLVQLILVRRVHMKRMVMKQLLVESLGDHIKPNLYIPYVRLGWVSRVLTISWSHPMPIV